MVRKHSIRPAFRVLDAEVLELVEDEDELVLVVEALVEVLVVVEEELEDDVVVDVDDDVA